MSELTQESYLKHLETVLPYLDTPEALAHLLDCTRINQTHEVLRTTLNELKILINEHQEMRVCDIIDILTASVENSRIDVEILELDEGTLS